MKFKKGEIHYDEKSRRIFVSMNVYKQLIEISGTKAKTESGKKKAAGRTLNRLMREALEELKNEVAE